MKHNPQEYYTIDVTMETSTPVYQCHSSWAAVHVSGRTLQQCPINMSSMSGTSWVVRDNVSSLGTQTLVSTWCLSASGHVSLSRLAGLAFRTSATSLCLYSGWGGGERGRQGHRAWKKGEIVCDSFTLFEE